MWKFSEGSINIKTLRNADGTMTGVAYIVRSITREDVEKRIVKSSSELALKPKPSLDITV